jgi:hypothetical protein
LGELVDRRHRQTKRTASMERAQRRTKSDAAGARAWPVRRH